MKTIAGRIIWGLLLVFVLFWALRWYQRKTVAPAMVFSDVALQLADEKKQVSLNDYAGKVLIVSCFQTWCRDCAKETPLLNQLAAKLPRENFQVIYITDENNARLEAFRRRLDAGNILFTISTKSLASLGIHVYPTTYLLDKKGNVVLTKLEGYNWLEEEGMIRNLLDQ